MPVTIWAAQDVEERRRFDYYRSGLCASFAGLSPERTDPALPFDARVRLSESGPYSFTGLTLQPHDIFRSARDVREAEDDRLYLNFVVRGMMNFSQGSTVASLARSDLRFVDNARQFSAAVRSDHRAMDLFVFRMPRESMSSDDLTLRTSRHTLAQALKHLLFQAASRQESWSDDEIADTGAAVSAVLKLILTHDDVALADPVVRATHTAVRRVIASDLSDSCPDIATVARELRLSVRTLQARLAMCGTTFTRMTTALRCDAVDRLLYQNPKMSVREALDRIGIIDAAGFHRAYRRERGHTPKRLPSG